MKPFFLVETTTKDGLIHQGIYFEPKKPHSAKASRGKRAILWIHGLTGTFYGHLKLHEELVAFCEKEGWGYAAFNDRGHDGVTSIKKVDTSELTGYTHKNAGAGYDVFEECIYDIQAAIEFLVKQGFSEIIAIGDSTGANKLCYYAGTQKDTHLAAVILTGPISDRLDIPLDKKKLQGDIVTMEQLVKSGKGDELLIGYHFFPLTPKRFISMYKPHTAEDVFDYGDTPPKLKEFSSIRQPLLVIVGEKDEYIDRTPEALLAIFQRHQQSRSYKGVIIADASHNFSKKEKELIESIGDWIKSV